MKTRYLSSLMTWSQIAHWSGDSRDMFGEARFFFSTKSRGQMVYKWSESRTWITEVHSSTLGLENDGAWRRTGVLDVKRFCQSSSSLWETRESDGGNATGVKVGRGGAGIGTGSQEKEEILRMERGRGKSGEQRRECWQPFPKWASVKCCAYLHTSGTIHALS